MDCAKSCAVREDSDLAAVRVQFRRDVFLERLQEATEHVHITHPLHNKSCHLGSLPTHMRHHIPSADDIADIDDQETSWFVSKRFRQDTHSMGVETGPLVQQANDSAAMHDNSASHQKSSRVSTEVAEQERREHAANIEYFFNDPVLSDSTTMIIVFQLEEPMKRDCSLILPPPSKYQRPTRN